MTQRPGSPRNRTQRFRWYATAVCLTCVMAGCRLPASVTSAKSGTPHYDRANIVYELDGSQRPLPLTDTAIKPASFEGDSEPASPGPEWSTATLALQYPHPDGKADTARATLRLSAAGLRESGSAFATASKWLGWSRASEAPEVGGPKPPSRDDEIWVLDIPRQQLDLLLTDLQQNGFFQAQTRSAGGTHLDVQLNWGRIQKDWSSEPRLDHFMTRVYREGRLEGLVARDASVEHSEIYAGR